MKRVLIAAILFVSSVASAQSLVDTIGVYRFGACDWWERITGTTGTAYACSFFPSNIEVTDAQDTVRVMNVLLEKIEALEARVKELEEAP